MDMERTHLSISAIEQQLAQPQLFRLAYFTSLDSTNEWALEKGRQGAPAGWVVIAESQRRGRGRYGRRWEDVPGKAILLSILVKGLPPDWNPLMLNYWVALQIADAIEDLLETPELVQLKWPNDIYVAGKKLGGILIEGNFSGQQPRFFVVGIGINVNQEATDFPPELQGQAISLKMVTGYPLSREALIARLLNRMAPLIQGKADSFPASFLPQYKKRLLYLGEPIEVKLGNQRIKGVFVDLTGEGFLVLQTSRGQQIIHSGEIFHES